MADNQQIRQSDNKKILFFFRSARFARYTHNESTEIRRSRSQGWRNLLENSKIKVQQHTTRPSLWADGRWLSDFRLLSPRIFCIARYLQVTPLVAEKNWWKGALSVTATQKSGHSSKFRFRLFHEMINSVTSDRAGSLFVRRRHVYFHEHLWRTFCIFESTKKMSACLLSAEFSFRLGRLRIPRMLPVESRPHFLWRYPPSLTLTLSPQVTTPGPLLFFPPRLPHHRPVSNQHTSRDLPQSIAVARIASEQRKWHIHPVNSRKNSNVQSSSVTWHQTVLFCWSSGWSWNFKRVTSPPAEGKPKRQSGNDFTASPNLRNGVRFHFHVICLFLFTVKSLVCWFGVLLLSFSLAVIIPTFLGGEDNGRRQ